MTSLENFRGNVRRVCALEGISQRELALRSGVALVHVSRILTGKADPSMTICERIAEAVGVPLAVLIGEPLKIFQQTA